MAKSNPFTQLYLGEVSTSSEDFVHLFSDLLVPYAAPLFSSSNVIVKGGQGMGKSMLLALLRPQVRALFCREGRPLPPETSHFFFSAEINLTTSSILEIGQRKVETTDANKYFCSMFEDYFNYFVLLGLLTNLKLMKKEYSLECFAGVITFNRLDDFAILLSQDECFLNYLETVDSMDALIARVKQRLKDYRQFFQFNDSDLNREIKESKTAIGDPLRAARRCLHESGCTQEEYDFYVTIEQFEILNKLGSANELAVLFKQLIHKALSARLPGVFYKIGTRFYGWDEQPQIYGNNLILEKERDYKELDLLKILRRYEDRKSYIFPDFASDVLFKRLCFAFPEVAKLRDVNSRKKTKKNIELSLAKKCLNAILGNGYSTKDLEDAYAFHKVNQNLYYPDDYPSPWKNYIDSLVREKQFLQAKLVHAWTLQQDKTRKWKNYQRFPYPSEVQESLPLPWDRVYWKKERKQQAYFQLATSAAQRLLWAGSQDVVDLSGDNILIFLNLCQDIWDLRDLVYIKSNSPDYCVLDQIDNSIQSTAIYNVSKAWYEKILEWPDGRTKQSFVKKCVTDLKNRLQNDHAMSYPGSIGFSLQSINEKYIIRSLSGQKMTIYSFLKDCMDAEILIIMDHTSKNKRGAKQKKIYFNSIYCPYLQLPEKHVKEPYYASTQDFLNWWGKIVSPGFPIYQESLNATTQQFEFNFEENDLG